MEANNSGIIIRMYAQTPSKSNYCLALQNSTLNIAAPHDRLLQWLGHMTLIVAEFAIQSKISVMLRQNCFNQVLALWDWKGVEKQSHFYMVFKQCGTTLCMILSVTYYLELRCATTFITKSYSTMSVQIVSDTKRCSTCWSQIQRA